MWTNQYPMEHPFNVSIQSSVHTLTVLRSSLLYLTTIPLARAISIDNREPIQVMQRIWDSMVTAVLSKHHNIRFPTIKAAPFVGTKLVHVRRQRLHVAQGWRQQRFVGSSAEMVSNTSSSPSLPLRPCMTTMIRWCRLKWLEGEHCVSGIHTAFVHVATATLFQDRELKVR